MEEVFPNLYVMLVAEPGWCRKGPPAGFAKKILMEVGVAVGIDSPTKRHLTKRLAELSKSQHFSIKKNGEKITKPQASLALVSKELSSFLAVDPKNMVEVLTDLYDCHEVWDYGTSTQGEDPIRGLCVQCFFNTTPMWIAKNLPEESIGGGFTTRFVIISATRHYKDVDIPPEPPPKLWRDLISDLGHIRRLSGEVQWSAEGLRIYREWYPTIRDWAKEVGDDRLFGSFSRVHTMAIKTAICFHTAKDDRLIIEGEDMEKAIAALTRVFNTASLAFSSHGRSKTAVETDRVSNIIEGFGEITFKKLLGLNYRNTDKVELTAVLDNLDSMGRIARTMDAMSGAQTITWTGRKKK